MFASRESAVTTPPRFRLLLPRSIYEEMVAHAQAELPAECCGLLAGRLPETGEPQAMVIVEFRYPLRNKLQSPTEYESDPKNMVDATRDMRERGKDMIAVYHSHPISPPMPSKKDLERNFYGEALIHFILSLAGPTPELRGWWLRETDYEPAEWDMV